MSRYAPQVVGFVTASDDLVRAAAIGLLTVLLARNQEAEALIAFRLWREQYRHDGGFRGISVDSQDL